MNRRCAVFGCDNSEQTNASFPFPDDAEQLHAWRTSLQLCEFPIELLKTRFVVCNCHFKEQDVTITDSPSSSIHSHRQEGRLRPLAVPTLNAKSTNDLIPSLATMEACETTALPIEIGEEMQPLAVGVSALTLLELSDATNTVDCMARSTTSTNKSDICILEPNESHYGDSTPPSRHSPCNERAGSEEYHCVEVPSHIDFTVLHAPRPAPSPTQTTAQYPEPAPPPPSTHYTHMPSNVLNESTEILMHSEMTYDAAHSAPGTDSDVEVLLSEDIATDEDANIADGDDEDDADGCLDDWLAAGAAGARSNAASLEYAPTLDGRRRLALPLMAVCYNQGVGFAAAATDLTTPSAEPLDSYEGRRLGDESTEHDISVEEFSRSSAVSCGDMVDAAGAAAAAYDHLSRDELLRVISRLEATVQRYHLAQQRLFELVEALRLEFSGEKSSRETIRQ